MVIESVLRGRFVLKHPFSMLLFGIVISVASMAISAQTFPNAASVLSIALITIGTIPLFMRIFGREERHELHTLGNPATFLGRHSHLISVFGYFFIGLILAHAYVYAEVPEDTRAVLFAEQDKTFSQIQSLRTHATDAGFTNACQSTDFWVLSLGCIFKNNAIVLGWTLLFSFLYGAGAIFLISWNASVIGVVIGKELIAQNHLLVLGKIGCLLPHGIPEIGAYFIGAIAGGIISAAIARRMAGETELSQIAKDALAMVILAYLLLLIGSVIESANITTACFSRLN